MTRHEALFSGLIYNEEGEPVQTTSVGDEACYAIPEGDFLRHIDAIEVDRQIVHHLKERFMAIKDVLIEGMMHMIGSDDPFSRAAIVQGLENMERILRKFETARTLVPGPVIEDAEDAKIGIIAYGTTEYAVQEARDRLADSGVPTSFLRLRALPINDDVTSFIDRHDRIYVVELNRDGQMHSILISELPEQATKLKSVAYLDGMPLTAHRVVDAILAEEQK